MFKRHLTGVEQLNHFLKEKLEKTQLILKERDEALTKERIKVNKMLKQRQETLTEHRIDNQNNLTRIRLLQHALNLKQQQCKQFIIQNRQNSSKQQQLEERLKQSSKNIILRLFKFDNYEISKQIQHDRIMNIQEYIDRMYEIGNEYVDHLESMIRGYQQRTMRLEFEIRGYENRGEVMEKNMEKIREQKENENTKMMDNRMMMVEEQKSNVPVNIKHSADSINKLIIPKSNLLNINNIKTEMREEQPNHQQLDQSFNYMVKIQQMSDRYIQSSWVGQRSDESMLYQ